MNARSWTNMYPERASLDGLEIEIFRLVSKSATPEQWAEWLRVPLEHAAAKGNHGLVDKLLGAGADGSAGWKGCGGRSLLYAAAVGGSEGVVSSLLRAGAQPDVNVLSPAPSSRSPLYQATLGGYEAAARLLIHASAEVNFMNPEDKRTVLHEALEGGHARLAEQLILSGADVEALDLYGTTPLHLAARKGLHRTVSVLLRQGVGMDALDNHGFSALMLASGANREQPHLAVVETLLTAGADLSICSYYPQSYTALGWASVSKLASIAPIIQALVRHGADVDSGDGFSALHSAAANDCTHAVDALIEAGMEMEMEMDDGRTPLCLAAQYGKSKTLLTLLQKGATIKAKDNTGKTPLHLVCHARRTGSEAVVQNLLRWGADETSLDDDGSSPEDLLDGGVVGFFVWSQDEIERVRLLLSRAPADRAWRRRGWLAMLRARASTANANAGSEGAEGSDDAGGGAGDSRRLVARSKGAVYVGGGGESGQAASGVGEIGKDGVGNGFFSSVVDRLVGLEPEVVFRQVLEFL